jgi:hypothetical protein
MNSAWNISSLTLKANTYSKMRSIPFEADVKRYNRANDDPGRVSGRTVHEGANGLFPVRRNELFMRPLKGLSA